MKPFTYSARLPKLDSFFVEGGEMDRLIRDNVGRRFRWIDDVMKREIPENIYRWAHSGQRFAMRKAAEWLADNGYTFRVWPDRTEICRGEKVLSTFKL